MLKLKQMAVAVTLALPMLANAQSNAQLKSEIDQLKAQVEELKALVKQQATGQPTAPSSGEAIDAVEFNKVRVKVEALEDSQETMGFKGLKISGFVDPTYIYNQARGKGSVSFLQDNYSSNPGGVVNDLTQDTFAYDNSYFGGVTLRFDKEFEGGVKAMLSINPRRSVANSFDSGRGNSIIEEALLTVPFNGLSWRVIAGQQITWNGYEYIQSNQKKNITTNLLLDFGGPGYVSGAGVEYQQGKWWIRTMAGNFSVPRDTGNIGRNQGLHWRVDYSKGEFQGWGASGMHGQIYGQAYNYLEGDAYFIRGNLTLQGQIEGSTWRNSAFNGGDVSTKGISGLAAWKFTPTIEGIVRADYLDNSKNGGGTPIVTMGNTFCPADLAADATGATAAGLCGDYRNGFGPGAVFDSATGVWALGDPNRGAKRQTYTFGLNWQYHTNGMVKLEWRHDRSDLYSFIQKDGSFKKYNNLIGIQNLVTF